MTSIAESATAAPLYPGDGGAGPGRCLKITGGIHVHPVLLADHGHKLMGVPSAWSLP